LRTAAVNTVAPVANTLTHTRMSRRTAAHEPTHRLRVRDGHARVRHGGLTRRGHRRRLTAQLSANRGYVDPVHTFGRL